MAFVKGKSGNPKGRAPGSLNKFTVNVKEMFDEVIRRKGGADGLEAWANANPDEFWKQVSKMLPKDVVVSGGDGEPIKIIIVTGVPEKAVADANPND
jgi:FAD/FMN-containing dehydrogenase